MAAAHGTRTRFNQGCRCDDCKQAERDYARARRQAKNVEKSGSGQKVSPIAVLNTGRVDTPSATQSSPSGEPTYGRVETAVRRQLSELSTVDSRGGEAEMAYHLASLMDNPKAAAAAQVQASRQLSELIDRLRKGADKKTGKLASVRRMSRPESATG